MLNICQKQVASQRVHQLGIAVLLQQPFSRINGNYGHTRDNQIYGYEYRGATSVVHAIDKKHIQIITLSALMAAKVLIGYNQPFVLLVAIVIVRVSASLLRIFILSILEQSVLEEVVLYSS